MSKANESLFSYLAVQYDKENGLTSWLDLFEKKIANVSSEINTLFDKTISKMDQTQWDAIFDDENGWDNFIEKNKIADENFREFLGTVGDAKFDIQDYQQYLIKSGKSTSDFTIFTKKASTALKSLGAAMASMAVNWAIGEIIALVVKLADNLAHSAEYCKERVDELMSSYKSALDKANSNAKTVEELASRYEELSKGVNNLGERVSLTTDEYTEYNKIVNQIADMFPALVQGYTNEGNAILSLKGNVEQLRDAYKKAQQEAYNLLIVNGKDSDGNDIIKNWKNLHNTDFFAKLFDFGIGDVNGQVSVQDAINQLKAFPEMSAEDFRKEEKTLAAKNHSIMGTDLYAGAFTASKYNSYIGKALGIDENVSDIDFEAAKISAKALIQTYQAEIDAALKNVQTLANAYLMTNEDYIGLDEQSKNAASIIVNSINESIANGFESKNDVSTYVTKIVEMINGNPDIKDALLNLFSLDMTNMPVSKAKELLDIYITSINDKLEENPVELKARLGFANIDDTYNRLRNSIRQITDDHGIEDRDEYAYLMNEIDFQSFTQAQVELWLEATRGAENAAQAVEMYNARLAEVKSSDPASFSDIFSLKDADNNLTTLGKISESIDTIQNAYKTLHDAIDEYNEKGAFSIDTLQSVIALGDDWLDYLVDGEGNLKLDKEALEDLTQARLNDMRVQAINNVINNVSKIQDEAGANEYLASTNYVLADSYEAVAKAKLSDAEASMAKAVEAGTLSQSSMDKALEKATADIDKINKLFANTSINGDSIMDNFGSSSSGGSAAKSEFSETVDFFAERVDKLKNAFSLLDASMDNISGSSAKNNLVDAELGITGEKFQNYTDALAMYTQKANEAFSKLPADIAAKVKDGAVALTDFIGDDNKDVVEAIKDYESWADKVTDCKQELAELKKEIRQLELEKFNNIMEDFNNQFDLRENSKDLISKQIDLLKEAGELIGESFYKTQIDQSKKQLELLEAENAQLVNQMSSAIGSGRIQKGTDEWLEMVNALSDVDGSILDCKKSIEEFDNSILDLHTEIFARIQEQFSNLDSEISNILDLFEEFEVSDDKGIWSKEGIAQMGMLTQQYELAQYQIQQYNNEIDELNAQYLAGRYSSTEYADKLADLNDGMWDNVKSAGSAKDAIMDLNEARVENAVKGIENEIDAYKELIDAQIDALKASKDLHDYEKSIAEKTKSITDLERRIAAMALDDSAASVAKRKKLEQQLSEAKADLEETQHQHSIEVQEDALNAQLEAYEKERNDEIDTLRESLNDKETILANSFETVKGNASTVGQEIAAIATQHGITVSKALISSWQSGEHAIASYGEVLSQNTSTFIGNIMGVENEVWNLQAQANTTADSLAWMFATKADRLVDELSTSYYSEMNLQLMTQALQDSLINTLERGYDVSSIVNSIDSVTDAAERAKKAIEELKLLDVSPSNVSGDRSTRLLSEKPNAIFYPSFAHYANGTRSSKENIIITDEEGYELKLPKLANGQYTIANEGTQILTKAETDNIFEWAKFDPKDFTSVNMAEYMDNLRAMSMPQVLPNNVNNNNSVNVHYDSMITVQGSLNSTDVKQMEAIANKAVDKMIDKIHDGITYGI